MSVKMHGWWFVVPGYIAHLVIAANREASVAKFKQEHPGVNPLYHAIANTCNSCSGYHAPIDRDVQKLQYPDCEPCSCDAPTGNHFMGNIATDYQPNIRSICQQIQQ